MEKKKKLLILIILFKRLLHQKYTARLRRRRLFIINKLHRYQINVRKMTLVYTAFFKRF